MILRLPSVFVTSKQNPAAAMLIRDASRSQEFLALSLFPGTNGNGPGHYHIEIARGSLFGGGLEEST